MVLLSLMESRALHMDVTHLRPLQSGVQSIVPREISGHRCRPIISMIHETTAATLTIRLIGANICTGGFDRDPARGTITAFFVLAFQSLAPWAQIVNVGNPVDWPQ